MDTKIFLERARARYGDHYSYELITSQTVASVEELPIVCKIHGVFKRQASRHMQGKAGCPECVRLERAARSKSRTLTWEQALARFKATHGDRYRYDEAGYQNGESKISITCQDHGPFLQTAGYHWRGGGCPTCGLENKALEFSLLVEKFRKKHGTKYSYPYPEDYTTQGREITIICPLHGEFKQTPAGHLAGTGCQQCGVALRAKSHMMSLETLIRECRLAHEGRYYTYPLDLNTETYAGKKGRLAVMCPDHGLFDASAEHHTLGGQICPDCLKEEAWAYFLERANTIHENAYEYTRPENLLELEGVLSYSRHKIVCKKHGEFEQSATNHLQGTGCPKCSNSVSKAEKQMRRFVESLVGEENVISNARGEELPGLGRFEVDILIPSKNLAIEFDGIIWHSERFSKNPKVKHLEKTELLNSLGYTLIHVFEDEWAAKRRITKNRLASLLVKGTSIPARKTKSEKISWGEASKFLTDQHLQGAGVPSKHCFGLFHEKELVAVATFGPARYGDKGWELLRFASVGRILGGAGKLLALFVKESAKPGEQLITYADRRWSEGGLYRALGFEFVGYSKPSYGYVQGTRNSVRSSRINFQKHKLAKLFDNFDPKLTEAENCNRNGYYRIYDCGTSKWRKIL